MKFSGVSLISADVPALAAFYTLALGCQPEGDNIHSEFVLDGLSLAIFDRQAMEQMAPGSMQGAGSGNVTLALEVEDVDKEYERIKALGFTFVKQPATHPWGARAFWFRDPDGNIVDFYTQLRPR
jgi:catechol 2,3-dioxygenase-like lactoylglutathione lyase family enzyme